LDVVFGVLKDSETIFIKIYVVAVKLSFGEAAHALLQNLFVSKIIRNPLNYHKNKNRNSLFRRTPCDKDFYASEGKNLHHSVSPLEKVQR
jgi:hypothetical protein